MLNISETILSLAAKRGKHKIICPSEVARALSTDDWHKYMKVVRKTAFELRDAGKVLYCKKEVKLPEVMLPGQ